MWNYGKKSHGRPFKKGHRPWNIKPIGEERITNAGFIEVKIAQPDCWKLKHLVVWEEIHGTLPENHTIDFIDGNRQNARLENLRFRPTRPQVGDERLGSKGFIEVKISAKRWRPKHIVVWEEAHGPLPKTHVLYFADGDKLNFNLANLVAFPKNDRIAELAKLHPGRGAEAMNLSLKLMAALQQQTTHRVLRINDELSFAQLEYLSLTNGGSDVFYRQ